MKWNHQGLQVVEVAVGLDGYQPLLALVYHPVLAGMAADVAEVMAGLEYRRLLEAALHYCRWVAVWVNVDDAVACLKQWWK